MSAGELRASVGSASTVASAAPASHSRPPAADAALDVVANYLLDASSSLKPALGYLYLLSAVDKGDEAKLAWLLENGVDPNARPAANEALEINGSRVTVKLLTGELTWAIDEGALRDMLLESDKPGTHPLWNIEEGSGSDLARSETIWVACLRTDLALWF
jgi:hypothetical protein